jgi:hypothetical protein
LQLVLSKLGFTLFSVVALLIQVPQPASGTYYIVNGALSPYNSEKLYATSNGNGKALIVAPLSTVKEEQQVWLTTSSYILLFVSLYFVVEYRT